MIVASGEWFHKKTLFRCDESFKALQYIVKNRTHSHSQSLHFSFLIGDYKVVLLCSILILNQLNSTLVNESAHDNSTAMPCHAYNTRTNAMHSMHIVLSQQKAKARCDELCSSHWSHLVTWVGDGVIIDCVVWYGKKKSW
jgi:PhoPQ-activated pathogenicity-related protein